LNSALHFLQYM